MIRKDYRMGVIGSGMMANVRCGAFLETGRVKLVGIASKTKKNAETFARRYGCSFSTTDYRELSELNLDFLLVELPHKTQEEVVRWAVENDFHVLVGSCISLNTREIQHLKRASIEKNLVIEGGFEARYKEVWKQSKKYIQNGEIGEVTAIQSIACWSAKTDSWYYSQEQSGGMPITHMTYAFLNPLTWIFGLPKKVYAFANTIGEKREGMVNEVSCVASILYDKKIMCSVLASYINHTNSPTWKVVILGTKGCLEVFPAEFGGGSLVIYRENRTTHIENFDSSPNSFFVQANAFIDALEGTNSDLQNSVFSGEEDVITANAIVESIYEMKPIELSVNPIKFSQV